MSLFAQQLIAENKATKNPFLDLWNCELTELPDELFDCVWLENLNLGKYYNHEKKQKKQKTKNKGEENQLKTLDYNNKNIALLTKLRILTFGSNKIVDISCLQGLSNLTIVGHRF